MKKYIFLIDISGIAYETIHSICGYKGKNLKSGRLGKFLEEDSEKEDFLYKMHGRIISKLNGVNDVCSGIEFVFDNFYGEIARKLLDRTYKEPREKLERAFSQKEFKNCLIEYKNQLDLHNITTFELAGTEADDILEYRARKLFSEGKDVCIMSSDSDLKQVIADSKDGGSIIILDMSPVKEATYVHMNSAITSQSESEIDVSESHSFGVIEDDDSGFSNIFSEEMDKTLPSWFQSVTRINPELELLRKVVAGDTSDNIPSPITYKKGSSEFGITKDRAKKVITDDFKIPSGFMYADIKKDLIFVLNESIKTKKDPEIIVDKKEYEEKFNHNLKLIRLDGSLLSEGDKKYIDSRAKESENNYKVLFENVMYQQTAQSWDKYNS